MSAFMTGLGAAVTPLTGKGQPLPLTELSPAPGLFERAAQVNFQPTLFRSRNNDLTIGALRHGPRRL